jgi:hypothetical protein
MRFQFIPAAAFFDPMAVVKTALDYFVCLQDKARDPANLHASLILGKDNYQIERIGWLDDPDQIQQIQAWIGELLDEGFTPIGFEVIKRDPEVFEELSAGSLALNGRKLLNDYLRARASKGCETADLTGKPT